MQGKTFGHARPNPQPPLSSPPHKGLASEASSLPPYSPVGLQESHETHAGLDILHHIVPNSPPVFVDATKVINTTAL